MSNLDAVFDYLAYLIAERGQDEPFLLSQIQPAITFKFPGFSFPDYGLANLKAFITMGEQAGYFKLVNTGDVKTMYLAPGAKRRTAAPSAAPSISELAADDPRRKRWMTEITEAILNTERGDQIVEVVRGMPDALSPDYDSYLAAEEHTTELYHVRGKIRRLRQFLKIYREKGETQALTSWQPSRIMLRTPAIPPVRDASRHGATIWAIMQGRNIIKAVPVEQLNNMFFAVIRYAQHQLSREKSWDWVTGLELLEAEARAVPRPAPPPPQAQKRGLFGGGPKPQTGPMVEQLDEAQIKALTQQLLREAGIRLTQDETTVWKAYIATEGLEGAYRFLAEQPKLLKDEQLLNWLEAQINEAVANNDTNLVRTLANKAALVISARQMGLEQVRQKPNEIKAVYESVLDGARLLSIVLAYLKPGHTLDARNFLEKQPELLQDDTVGVLLESQLLKAAQDADVARYRLVGERMDLWRNVAEFGPDQGMAQHARFATTPREDKTLLTEMGLLLLQEAKDIETQRDVLERFPTVATKEGLAMANATLEMLSFQNASTEEYNHYFEVKRLIERCVSIGIDRALAELK